MGSAGVIFTSTNASQGKGTTILATVYYHFAKWRDDEPWRKLNKYLRRKLKLGRNEESSAGCAGRVSSSEADSQSVKAGNLHNNGYDGAKSVNGSKRHLLVGILGLVLSVLATRAGVPERKGLCLLLQQVRPTLTRFHHLWLDRGYKGVAFPNTFCFASASCSTS